MPCLRPACWSRRVLVWSGACGLLYLCFLPIMIFSTISAYRLVAFIPLEAPEHIASAVQTIVLVLFAAGLMAIVCAANLLRGETIVGNARKTNVQGKPERPMSKERQKSKAQRARRAPTNREK